MYNNSKFLEAAQNIWGFIEKNIVDKEYGEWFAKVKRKGQVDKSEDKIAAWKSCYHNIRACLEIIERLKDN